MKVDDCNNIMTTRDKLVHLKNVINDVLEKERVDYYDAMDIRKGCVDVEDAIDNIFDEIEIDLNV